MRDDRDILNRPVRKKADHQGHQSAESLFREGFDGILILGCRIDFHDFSIDFHFDNVVCRSVVELGQHLCDRVIDFLLLCRFDRLFGQEVDASDCGAGHQRNGTQHDHHILE